MRTCSRTLIQRPMPSIVDRPRYLLQKISNSDTRTSIYKFARSCGNNCKKKLVAFYRGELQLLSPRQYYYYWVKVRCLAEFIAIFSNSNPLIIFGLRAGAA